MSSGGKTTLRSRPEPARPGKRTVALAGNPVQTLSTDGADPSL